MFEGGLAVSAAPGFARAAPGRPQVNRTLGVHDRRWRDDVLVGFFRIDYLAHPAARRRVLRINNLHKCNAMIEAAQLPLWAARVSRSEARLVFTLDSVSLLNSWMMGGITTDFANALRVSASVLWSKARTNTCAISQSTLQPASVAPM